MTDSTQSVKTTSTPDANRVRRPRTARPAPSVSNSEKRRTTIGVSVSPVAERINERTFPVFGLFVLNPEHVDLLYMKLSKSECVEVATGKRCSTNAQGYRVSIA